MHVMIRHYQMRGAMEDLLERVRRQFAGQLANGPADPPDSTDPPDAADAPVRVPAGILGYQAVWTGPDTLLTITTFATEDDLRRAVGAAADIRKSLADFEVEETATVTGEIAINQISPELLAATS